MKCMRVAAIVLVSLSLLACADASYARETPRPPKPADEHDAIDEWPDVQPHAQGRAASYAPGILVSSHLLENSAVPTAQTTSCRAIGSGSQHE